MRNLLVLVVLLSFSLPNWAQEMNRTTIDSRIKKEILYGQVNLEAFQTDLCRKWYLPEFQSYSPSKRIVKKLLEQDLSNISITIVFGSWCHDSHREVPRFMRILKDINYPADKTKLFSIDTYKKAPGFDTKSMGVQKVPTFIIYRHDKEIGRIIETPKRRLEKDLLHIIVKN